MDFKYRDILLNNEQLGPYPLEKLKRVNVATTHHTEQTKQRSVTDHPFYSAKRGELGQKVKDRSQIFQTREPLLAALTSVHHHLAGYKPPDISLEKAPISDDPRILSRHIKSLAYFLGADMVGICKIPKSAMYSHDKDGNPIQLEYESAIVMLNIKHTDTIRASYGFEWIDDPVSFQVYQKCGLQCEVIADYILRLGYPAYSSFIETYANLMTPLIIESGLGEGSRLGIAINPFVGASFKVGAVLTDLPLAPDMPIDFGLQDYCRNCMICAEQCPMHAISDREEETYNGYKTWRHNRKLCYTGIMTNPVGNMCQRCAKICPWNRSDNQPEDFRDWDGNLDYLYESVNRQVKHLIDNNFVEPDELKNKWWFPLEYKDGKLTDAPEFDYSTHSARINQLKKKKKAGLQLSLPPDYE